MTTSVLRSSVLDHEDDDRELLLEIVRACGQCELACIVSSDLLGTPPASVLPLCAQVTSETARTLARMETPDVSAVASPLLACRTACAIARLACHDGDHEVLRRCERACAACEDACGRALATLDLAV